MEVVISEPAFVDKASITKFLFDEIQNLSLLFEILTNVDDDSFP